MLLNLDTEEKPKEEDTLRAPTEESAVPLSIVPPNTEE